MQRTDNKAFMAWFNLSPHEQPYLCLNSNDIETAPSINLLSFNDAKTASSVYLLGTIIFKTIDTCRG
jgi:hypothetical protein